MNVCLSLEKTSSKIESSLLSGPFLIKFSPFVDVASKLSGLERPTSVRKTQVRIPAGLRCVFPSDPAVSSSIFVEKKEKV